MAEITDRNILAEMRAWCRDCFTDMPDDATDAEVVRCVARQYDGGVMQFAKDAS